MKRSLILTFAAAFFALTACQKEVSGPVQMKTVRFQATDIETKAIFGTPSGNTYPTLWTATSEKAGISLNLDTQVAAAVTPSADFKSATFSAQFNAAETGPYTFVAFHPNSAVRSISKTNKTLNIEFPSSQTTQATTPDENAQIIYAISQEYTNFPEEEVPLSFKHVPAYLHLTFNNATLGDAKVSAVNITASTKITGRWFFNLEEGTVSENATGSTISVETDQLENVWCALAPVDLSNKTLTFVIATDKGTITKEITLPANRKLASGKIAKLAVDLTGISIQEPIIYKLVKSTDELYFGDRVIIVSDGDLEKALGSTQNSNNRSAADIKKDGDYIYSPSQAVQELLLEEGAIPGAYSFKTTGGYLYAPGGGNYLRTQTAKDAASTFAITITPEATKIIGQKSGIPQNEMRYNNNDGSNLFSCYATSSSCKPVALYRQDIDPVDAEQYFSVTLPGETTLSASAHDVQVYVFGNVAWTASATSGTLDVTSGNTSKILTLSIPENTSSSAITYTVTVSTTATLSPNSYEFIFTQAAPSGEKLPAGTILWSEDWEGGAKNDTPAAYLAKDSRTTVVYNNATITYSQTNGGSNTKLYDDYLVYVNSNYTGTDKPADKKMNLLLSKSNGTWTITGIPCKNVSKAKLTFHSNYGTAAYSNLATTTAGITIGAFNTTDYQSDWNKKVYVNSHEITFSGTAETFNLTFKNTNGSNNVRLDDITLEVLE